ncbi:MAG: GtrA-like protein [candidate division WS6 bacterium GW2011_GWA2_37_6]|uniref:GtrA-like protein n=1 Tax=candidate division WS6 bacterium GW2011_GWA2_37_6 TaxID=1619087 RepID=A0A0G0H0L0_9BACT|nr:MAG: GtrA-like protein [candidate division WS6 bacterium GW2011_GWA2_37_6]
MIKKIFGKTQKKIALICRDKELRRELIKYIFISVFGYVAVFICLYLLIDILGINERVSYFFIYVIFYVITYLLGVAFVFKTSHSNKKVFKFLIYIIIFFSLNNLIFNVILFSGLSYQIVVIITMFILFPLRFLSSKLVVYK